MNNSIEAFPLTWPDGWPRTDPRKRMYSKFTTTLMKARDEIISELRRLGARGVIISSDIPLRQDGMMYAGRQNPKDTGVAVYFTFKDKSMVFACDKFIKIHENLQAIKKTIEALRGIERWGASDMLERAFTGFQALPEPYEETWRDVLEMDHNESPYFDEIKAQYRSLSLKYHPDHGGDGMRMTMINQAFEDAKTEYGIK